MLSLFAWMCFTSKTPWECNASITSRSSQSRKSRHLMTPWLLLRDLCSVTLISVSSQVVIDSARFAIGLETTSTRTVPLHSFFSQFYIFDSTLKDFLNRKYRKFDRRGISVLHHREVGKRLIRIILRDMNRFCSLSFSYIQFCWLKRWRRGEGES